MSIITKIIGPKSKYDKTLPYTYLAKVQIISGDDEFLHYYFSDTICGLIEYLDENKINPFDTQLYGCYLKKEIPLDKKYCLTEDGQWLKRPEICRSLETHYKETLEVKYKGHIELGECSFEDRDRRGDGPF